MDDDATPIEDFPAPDQPASRRKLQSAVIAAGVISIASLILAGLLAPPGLQNGKLITGAATANPAAVIAAADERKAPAAVEAATDA
jgi:hypothetical protein